MHPRTRWIGFACALTLQACANRPVGGGLLGKTWVVLPTSAPLVAQLGGTWTPSAEQALAARDAAKRQVALDAHRRLPHSDRRWWLGLDYASDMLREWQAYRMQAYGVTVHGKRVVHLSFLTPDHPDDGGWRRDLLIIGDGGYAFWDAEYDPSSGKILWWQTHGVA